jgi:hypothetical protein
VTAEEPTAEAEAGTESSGAHTLLHYPEHLAVVRFGPGSDLPPWAASSSILSVTATAAETSVICAARDVPTKSRHVGPYVAFVVAGTLDPDQVGVLHGLLGPLAEAGVPVMTLSTFDTDWILVPAGRAEAAVEAWRRSGHTVDHAPASPEPEPPERPTRDRPRKKKNR